MGSKNTGQVAANGLVVAAIQRKVRGWVGGISFQL